jgi:hypothetical protein
LLAQACSNEGATGREEVEPKRAGATDRLADRLGAADLTRTQTAVALPIAITADPIAPSSCRSPIRRFASPTNTKAQNSRPRRRSEVIGTGGTVTADAEPSSESAAISHCQSQGITGMFCASRLYDTRWKIPFASQSSVTKPGWPCTSASAIRRGLVLESVVCGTSDDVSRHSVPVAPSA